MLKTLASLDIRGIRGLDAPTKAKELVVKSGKKCGFKTFRVMT